MCDIDIERIKHWSIYEKSHGRVAHPRGHDKAQFTCHHYVVEKQVMFAGVSDGTICSWRKRSDLEHDTRCYIKLTGHLGRITCITENPDKLIVSGSADRSVIVWDPWVRDAKKSRVQTLHGHGGTISDLSYFDDVLITVSTDCTMKVWTPMEGRRMLLYPFYSCSQTITFSSWVTCVEACASNSFGGGVVLCGGCDGTVTMLQRIKGEFVHIRSLNKLHVLGITKMLHVSDENLLVTMAFDNTVRACYVDSGGVFFVAEPKVRGSRYCGLAWNQARQELMLIDQSGYLYIWNIFSETLVHQARVYKQGGILDLSLDIFHGPHGFVENFFFTVPGGIEFHQVHREMAFKEFTGHEGALIAVVCPDVRDIYLTSKALAGMAGGKRVFTEDLEEQAENKSDEPKDFLQQAIDEMPQEIAKSFKKGKAKRTGTEAKGLFFTAALDNTLRIWNTVDMRCIQVLREKKSEIASFAYSSLHDTLISGHDNGAIRLWNTDAGTSITMTGHANTVCALAMGNVNKNDRYLLSGSFDGWIGVWDIRWYRSVKPHNIMMYRAHEEEVLCIISHDITRTYISGSNDTLIKIWSDVSHELTAVLAGHKDSVTCFALDENFLFSGSDDKTIRIWDTIAAVPIAVLSSHTQPVRQIISIPDSGYLVSCSSDQRTLMWDYTKRKPVEEFKHKDSIRCLSYVHDKKMILAGTDEHTVVSFPVPEKLRSDVDENTRLDLEEIRSRVDSLNDELTGRGSRLSGRTIPDELFLGIKADDAATTEGGSRRVSTTTIPAAPALQVPASTTDNNTTSPATTSTRTHRTNNTTTRPSTRQSGDDHRRVSVPASDSGVERRDKGETGGGPDVRPRASSRAETVFSTKSGVMNPSEGEGDGEGEDGCSQGRKSVNLLSLNGKSNERLNLSNSRSGYDYADKIETPLVI